MCVGRGEEDGDEREGCLKPKAPPKLGYKIRFKRRGLHPQEPAVPGWVRGGLPGSVAAGSSAAEGRSWFPVSPAGTHCGGRPCVHTGAEAGPSRHGMVLAATVTSLPPG